MRNLILILIALFIFTQSDAQHRFSKYYHNDISLRTNNQAKDFYELPDSGFLLPTISSNLYVVDTLGFARTYFQIIRTNSKGDTIWTKLYFKKHFNIRVRFIVKMQDGNFLLAGNEFDLVKYHNDTIGSKILLIKITPNGDTLWTKTLDIGDGDEFAVKVINTIDSGFAIVGQVCNKLETNCDMYLMKLDSNANEEWHKTFTCGTNYWESPTSVLQGNLGEYYLTSATQDLITDIYYPYIVKVNSLGQLLWQKRFDNEGQNYAYMENLCFAKNNTILFAGVIGDNIPIYSVTKGWIVRTDTSGNVIYNFKHGENNFFTFYNYISEFGNNIIVSGATNNYNVNSLSSRTCLYSFTNNGNVNWKRVYQDSLTTKATYITYQTKQTIDGGFAMIGFGDNPKDTLINQDVWFLKVDSMGCLYDNCLSMGIEDEVHIEPVIKVYPNPSNGVINIESDFTIIKIELIDAFGRIVLKELINKIESINVAQFPPGLYYLRMETENGKFYTEKVVIE